MNNKKEASGSEPSPSRNIWLEVSNIADLFSPLHVFSGLLIFNNKFNEFPFVAVIGCFHFRKKNRQKNK